MRFAKIPHNERLFWGHMWQYVNSSFNEEYVAYWAAHYGEKANGQTHGGDEQFGGITNSTRSRTNKVNTDLRRAIPEIDFAITTNDGNPLKC